MVMKAGQRKEKRAAAAAAGKPTHGPAGYCEAACATVTVFTSAHRCTRSWDNLKGTL